MYITKFIYKFIINAYPVEYFEFIKSSSMGFPEIDLLEINYENTYFEYEQMDICNSRLSILVKIKWLRSFCF